MPAAPNVGGARSLSPMLASVASALPAGPEWTFEPKYDGIRVLAHASVRRVELRTRNGIDKAKQFPEVVEALRDLAKSSRKEFVVDGEIVARDGNALGRFQGLQERLHQRDATIIARHVERSPARLVALDLVSLGGRSLVREPWRERRQALERLLAPLARKQTSPLLLGETIPHDGPQLLARARREGWEGIMAKRMDVPYAPGKRSPHWLKLKIEGRQELVVGGWTEPRKTRQHIGALLLGYYDDEGQFVYAGHTGGGFTHVQLREMHELLAPLERKTSPFAVEPRTNERAHWTKPSVVVEVKFNEWTNDGRLRQPIFLGVRDDKVAREVKREAPSNGNGIVRHRAAPKIPHTSRVVSSAVVTRSTKRSTPALKGKYSLDFTHLDKEFFPKSGITKGDLLSYYADVAPALLPLIKDRPLVLKRYPNGIAAPPFYQQNAPANPPAGVRVERVATSDGKESTRLVGGDITTLLYCVQLGCIEVHPWHSRIQSIGDADYSIIDLDPGDRAPFSRVVRVAQWLHEMLNAAGLHAGLKTSGASGIHIYIPLPLHTSYESSRLIGEVFASRVAHEHPKEATVIRAVKARARNAVYVDFLQNVEGKSVAAPFSVRPHEGASVSTPLDWSELSDSLSPAAFTMSRVVRELKERRALWTAAMRRRNTLRALQTLEQLR